MCFYDSDMCIFCRNFDEKGLTICDGNKLGSYCEVTKTGPGVGFISYMMPHRSRYRLMVCNTCRAKGRQVDEESSEPKYMYMPPMPNETGTSTGAST